jgi:hypothetical protein
MAKNRIGFSNDFILKDEQIGINTTSPRATLDVEGDSYVSGIVTSGSGFYGDLYGSFFGVASTATSLENPRTFEITGDIAASPIAFDGTGNVSLAATIQPNSVGLGTDTFGDYVESISGTANEIDVTGGTGEGSTPVISFAPNPTIGGNVTIGNDLQVNNNLNVTGNITVGGTAGYILVNEFRVSDADIILGFTTDISGNDVSNDTTANHGGIAVASTEGNPLVSLNIAGIETLPPTYKKIMWFKAGAFAGLNTDAWLSNYAIGIGSTQFPSGTRLAAGSVQFTENDLAVVRNINASGIITATTFYGDGSNLDNIVATSGDVNYAGVAGIATYADIAGIATYANVAGIATYAVTAGVATYAGVSGIATVAQGLTGTPNLNVGIVTATEYYGTFKGTIDSGVTLDNVNYANVAGVSTNVIGGIASVTQLSVSGVSTFTGIGTFQSDLYVGGDVNIVGVLTAERLYSNVYGEFTGGGITGDSIVGTALSISGISTLGTVQISSGIVTATSGVVTYYGDGSKLTGITASGAGGVSISTNTTNQVQYIPYATSFGSTTGLGATTLLVYNPYSGNVGVGTENPTAKLHVIGDVNIVGVLTAQRLYSNIYGEFTGGGITGDSIVGTALSISGISTLGSVQISSGIVTATSGVVTYYGDGQYLSGVVSPESNGEFYTGVSSSIQLTPLSYETSIYTFPSTAGKQYVIESINVANVDTSVGVGTTVNIIASIADSSGEQTYIAYNVPIVNGGLIELLKNAIVAGPSDVMKMWVTDGNYIGVNNSAEVYMNYTEFTSTEYIREYASTVSIATTDATAVYTSSTYPSTIEAIHLTNRTDIGDYPVSVSITNGVTTTYLAKDLLIPRYATVDILDRPKRIELNGVIKVEVGQTSTIDVIIAGKQITS